MVDPYSGVTLDVEDDSPQAKAWGGRPAAEVPQDAVAEPDTDSVKRKPGRPRKSD